MEKPGVAMNPAKRARLLQIPAQLKQLASEALDILEEDEYFASQSQWRGELFAAIARLEKVISEQVEGGGQFVSPAREIPDQTD